MVNIDLEHITNNIICEHNYCFNEDLGQKVLNIGFINVCNIKTKYIFQSSQNLLQNMILLVVQKQNLTT